MTATEIKKAFKEGSPVWYHPPNEKPIECSGIIEVIYSKGKKGNIICSCILPNISDEIKSRYLKCESVYDGIHLKKASKSNSNTDFIKKAFKKDLSVWYCPPNEKPIHCSKIIKIIYSKGKKGNMICSCLLQDAKCPHSVMRVRCRYVKAEP